MELSTQIWIAGLAFLVALVVILPILKRDYLKRGKLSHFTAFLQLGLWFFYQVFLALTVFGDLWPPLEAYIPKNQSGGILMLAGLVLCLAGIWAFRSITKVTGREANRLVIHGIYRWSRNPQYLGYGVVVLGAVIGYWSSTAWLALIGYVLLAYFTVRVEEAHLANVFGEAYRGIANGCRVS